MLYLDRRFIRRFRNVSASDQSKLSISRPNWSELSNGKESCAQSRRKVGTAYSKGDILVRNQFGHIHIDWCHSVPGRGSCFFYFHSLRYRIRQSFNKRGKSRSMTMYDSFLHRSREQLRYSSPSRTSRFSSNSN